MTILRNRRTALGIALLAAVALVAAACAAEDTGAADAAAAASADAAAAMAAAQGAQAGADAADAKAASASAEASAATAAADAAAAAAAEAEAAAELAQATASGSAEAIAEAEAALADAQAAAEAAGAQAAAAQEEAAAAQAEAAAAQAEAAAAQEEAAAAQAEAAAAQEETAAAQEEVAAAQAQLDAAAAEDAYMYPGAGTSVTQARASWTTGYMQAAIYRQLLEELGYDVSEPADNELGNDIFYVALGEGEVDFWANGWIPNHLKFFEAELADGTTVADHVTIVGWELAGAGLEGLLTNKSVAEEYGITTLGQINDDPELIALYDATDTVPGDGVVQLLVCPDGWTCDDIMADTVVFNEWENLEVVRAGYDAMFAEAVAKVADGEPVIVYTWSPSGYLTSLIPGNNVIWLALEQSSVLDGTTSTFNFADLPPAALGPDFCTNDPCYTGWPAADIRVVANNDFLAANPAAQTLFENVVISVVDVALQNVRYEAGENTTADVNHHAALWIENNRAQVDEWLTAARDAA